LRPEKEATSESQSEIVGRGSLLYNHPHGVGYAGYQLTPEDPVSGLSVQHIMGRESPLPSVGGLFQQNGNVSTLAQWDGEDRGDWGNTQ